MKITEAKHSRPTLFTDLEVGDTFYYDDRLYLRVCDRRESGIVLNAVDLERNRICYFDSTPATVHKVDAGVIVETP